MNATERNSTIDAFRGIFILFVLGFHYFVRWAPPFSYANVYGFSKAYDPIFEFGKFGVEFFFIISGLVISFTIERSQSVVDFAFRRFSRLFPALVCACLLTYLVGNSFGPPELTRSPIDIASSLAMLPSLLPSRLGFHYVDGVYWSLAVEIKFYAVVALSYLFLRDRYWIGIVIFAILGAALKPLASNLSDKIFIQQYMSFFLLGISIFHLSFSGKLKAAAINALLAAILFFTNSEFITLQEHTSVLAFWLVALCAIVMSCFICLRIQIGWYPLVYLGQISYSLYLLHENIGLTIIHYIVKYGGPDLLAILGATTISIILASAMNYLIEKPMQSWLRKGYSALFQAPLGFRSAQPMRKI